MGKKFFYIRQTVTLLLFGVYAFMGYGKDSTFRIQKHYLNLPVSHQVNRQKMTLFLDGKPVREFMIRLASEQPDYWVFCDISTFQGKKITVSYDGDGAGLHKIYQDNQIAGCDSIYQEKNRPQLHYTPRRGWNNDPNGLVWYEDEYHLFYQHNPYEREWENMHWGHAVSRDLIHWEELDEALYPGRNGSAFSGSVVIDYENTSGFGKKGMPAMVAVYTGAGAKQVQCVAYSLDKGRTWTDYEKNPVIDSGEKWNSVDTRDPKVFWYKPNNEWVMVLNERDGNSIYTSSNLKNWTYQSHVTGFWECPELFELPIDGNPEKTQWVMYGASGTYMLGSFNGKEFVPQAGKFYYCGGQIYAPQTYNNIPKNDGRRIQIGWDRINHPNMPICGCMTLPTELTLKTTSRGVRLFCTPIKEVESLELSGVEAENLTAEQANEILKPYADKDMIRLRFTIKLSHATSAGISLCGQNLLDYDMNNNRVNGSFYSPEPCTSMELSVDMIVDRTVVDLFVDGGAYVHFLERQKRNNDGFFFWGKDIEIKSLKIHPMQSIWKN